MITEPITKVCSIGNVSAMFYLIYLVCSIYLVLCSHQCDLISCGRTGSWFTQSAAVSVGGVVSRDVIKLVNLHSIVQSSGGGSTKF